MNNNNNRSQLKTHSPRKSKNDFSMEHTGKTLLDYFRMDQKSSKEDYIQHSSIFKQDRKLTIIQTKLKAENCIMIDSDDDNMMNKSQDNDIQEIQKQK